ncbi:helix-turn-helix transcriptional regulator [Halobacillus locisalis]|uniref:Helix-turn-helix transcriptional regulator n=1 Tax=Halobacillus locisalis TaxID=220753 RepID=A0A838CXZ5_9BACI|nr:helix-turn-helix transcriptional regulator [Halobacillus locisalis]MBA2176820.1 helix-turn-helix transcriptional regulator [Halobacillus locisalis]
MEEIEKKEVVSLKEAVVYRIRELMKINNIRSVHKLAHISEVRQSTLNEILKGRSSHPNILTISKVAHGCDITLQEFFDHPIFSRVEGMPNLQSKKQVIKKSEETSPSLFDELESEQELEKHI